MCLALLSILLWLATKAAAHINTRIRRQVRLLIPKQVTCPTQVACSIKHIFGKLLFGKRRALHLWAAPIRVLFRPILFALTRVAMCTHFQSPIVSVPRLGSPPRSCASLLAPRACRLFRPSASPPHRPAAWRPNGSRPPTKSFPQSQDYMGLLSQPSPFPVSLSSRLGAGPLRFLTSLSKTNSFHKRCADKNYLLLWRQSPGTILSLLSPLQPRLKSTLKTFFQKTDRKMFAQVGLAIIKTKYPIGWRKKR